MCPNIRKKSFTKRFAIELICRHETPVLANPIKLIHVDEDLVVLDKPCSLPVSTRVFPVCGFTSFPNVRH